MRIRKKKTAVALVLIFLFAAVLCKLALAMGKGVEAPRMTKEELKASLLLGNPDLTVLDVRTSGEWGVSKEKIQGAIREDPENVKTWSNHYSKHKTLVLYCSSVNEKKSAWTARQLIARGFIRVYVLKEGWKGWKKAGFPVEPK
ncbi:MAG: rhodanese-related (seleno)protein [Thermodesulfobacteriota bacterium]|jgi:rhodanese-related sulfurtransferase